MFSKIFSVSLFGIFTVPKGSRVLYCCKIFTADWSTVRTKNDSIENSVTWLFYESQKDRVDQNTNQPSQRFLPWTNTFSVISKEGNVLRRKRMRQTVPLGKTYTLPLHPFPLNRLGNLFCRTRTENFCGSLVNQSAMCYKWRKCFLTLC